MDIGLNSSVTSPPQQSPSLINMHGTARTRFCVRKPRPKRSSKRRRPTGKRPSHRYGSVSSGHSETDSSMHIPSFAHTSQTPQEEVGYMKFGNMGLVQCNRFWETYGRARQWQHRHQIAYWKSRTITLESENNKLRTCLDGKSNLCQPNVHPCEPGRFGPTQQNTFPQYYVPNDHLQDQQANATYGTAPVKTDRPITRQYESSRPGSSGHNTPEINDGIGTPSYFRDDLNRTGKEVDNSYLTTITEENDEDEESFEFEINEEMMAFLQQSMKHKLELKEQREKERLQSEEEKRQYEYECSLPPQHICKKRIAEMKLLYGAGAPKIIGMETAVKLTFERRLKKHEPKLWPVIPLRP